MRKLVATLAAAVGLSVLAVPAAGSAGSDPGTEFYVPKPNHGAVEQVADVVSSGDKDGAAAIREMIGTPQAVWIEQGTPAEAKREVRRTVKSAKAKKTVPVLVAYNIPFRDCAQFSAGGATTKDEYIAWIDGFAAGIRDESVVVILEPDGLGIIPWYTNIDGNLDWCQPAEADPDTAAAERFEMLEYAVDALQAKPNALVYLDGTHSAWLNVGDNAQRLDRAGVDDADGFYLNVSNYQFTANLVEYGAWVSSCLEMEPNFSGCPNQYWNGGPASTKIADLLGPWAGVALSSYGQWSDEADDPDLNTSGINARYAGVEPTTHFVIDTSRNGQGPWDAAPAGYPDPQDWCNPPERGLGLRPTADTGVDLVDAYLWIKLPGESDGECTRGLGDAGVTVDPVWGIIDPGAGDWFPEMVLDLTEYANPPLVEAWPVPGWNG